MIYLIGIMIVTNFTMASNYNEKLISTLYDNADWVLEESKNGINIYKKNIEDITLDAIMVSKTISFPAYHTLSVIKDIKNYNNVLVNSSSVKTKLISDSGKTIIAFQSIEIPILSDLYYFFKIYNNADVENSVIWTLEAPEKYSNLISQNGFPLDVGCGGWDYVDNGDGTFLVNYRLIMDIEGYPRWAVNYINYYSILNVFNDVLLGASQYKE